MSIDDMMFGTSQEVPINKVQNKVIDDYKLGRNYPDSYYTTEWLVDNLPCKLYEKYLLLDYSKEEMMDKYLAFRSEWENIARETIQDQHTEHKYNN